MLSAWTLGVAGWSISIVSEDADLRIAPSGVSNRFCVTDVAPDLVLTVRREVRRISEDARCTFDSGGVWISHETATDFWISLRSALFLSAPYLVARISKNQPTGELYVHPNYAQGRTLDPLEYPLDELLFLGLIAKGQGLEVHAAGVDAGPHGGWLLLGHSGAGKSTASGLLIESGLGEILSDDRIVLRRRDSKGGSEWWMFGTPWHGTGAHAVPRGCPLKRIYVLSHAPVTRLGELPRSVFTAEIVARTFHPLYAPHVLAYTLKSIEHLTQDVPCRTLAFRPDREMPWVLASDSVPSTQNISLG
ncbi:MAG: hypothetical protein ACKVPX_12705 [Myxococcaceae bacterium]